MVPGSGPQGECGPQSLPRRVAIGRRQKAQRRGERTPMTRAVGRRSRRPCSAASGTSAIGAPPGGASRAPRCGRSRARCLPRRSNPISRALAGQDLNGRRKFRPVQESHKRDRAISLRAATAAVKCLLADADRKPVGATATRAWSGVVFIGAHRHAGCLRNARDVDRVRPVHHGKGGEQRHRGWPCTVARRLYRPDRQPLAGEGQRCNAQGA